MAAPTRTEFDALAARVRALEQGSTPDPAQPTPPASGITAGTPTVTVNGSSFTVTAAISAGAQTQQLAFLQLAVRGAGASDLSRSPNTTLVPGVTKILSGVGAGTGGAYSTWVAYSLDGSTWVDGPKATFTLAQVVSPATPDTPVAPSGNGSRRIPLAASANSKLRFNSIVFRQSGAAAKEFGDRRGTPVDGFLYFTPRQSWGDLNSHAGDHKDWLGSGRLIVMTLPHAPQPEGPQMNQRGANDGYRDQQRAFGKWHADNGYNSEYLTIRVDWESNGNWYPWNSGNPGGAEALKAAIRNFVTNVRAGGLTKVKFDLCFNKGPSQTGKDFEVFPGGEYIDTVGVDQYDMWSPSFSAADWAREAAKRPSIASVIAFAKAQGVMWSIDEGGNTHGSGGAYGGDNPTYWQLVHDTITANAEGCAWHCTYDDQGAPATLMHDFARNPNSWAKYRQLWTP